MGERGGLGGVGVRDEVIGDREAEEAKEEEKENEEIGEPTKCVSPPGPSPSPHHSQLFTLHSQLLPLVPIQHPNRARNVRPT